MTHSQISIPLFTALPSRACACHQILFMVKSKHKLGHMHLHLLRLRQFFWVISIWIHYSFPTFRCPDWVSKGCLRVWHLQRVLSVSRVWDLSESLPRLLKHSTPRVCSSTLRISLAFASSLTILDLRGRATKSNLGQCLLICKNRADLPLECKLALSNFKDM